MSVENKDVIQFILINNAFSIIASYDFCGHFGTILKQVVLRKVIVFIYL